MSLKSLREVAMEFACASNGNARTLAAVVIGGAIFAASTTPAVAAPVTFIEDWETAPVMSPGTFKTSSYAATKGWTTGGGGSNWAITDRSSTSPAGFSAGAPPEVGSRILMQASNGESFAMNGSSSWRDYSVQVLFGRPQASGDNDMMQFWGRVNAFTSVRIQEGYFFYMQDGGLDTSGFGFPGIPTTSDVGIAKATVVNGVARYTILADNRSHPALQAWDASYGFKSTPFSPDAGNQNWNVKLRFWGDTIELYLGAGRGNQNGIAPAVPAAPIVSVTDSSYSTGRIAMSTLSQIAWFDNIRADVPEAAFVALASSAAQPQRGDGLTVFEIDSLGGDFGNGSTPVSGTTNDGLLPVRAMFWLNDSSAANWSALRSALDALGGVNASLAGSGDADFALLAQGYQGFDLLVEFDPSVSNAFLAWDFTGYGVLAEQVAVVPEPGTFAALVLVAPAICGRKRALRSSTARTRS